MKNQKGITLIALVVTIIILLILASTTLAALLDDEGLSNQAVDLSKNVEKSSKENDKKIKDMADELDSIMNPEESPQIEVVQDGKTVWKDGKATIKLKVLDGGYPTDEYDILYKKTASTGEINRVWNTYKDSITGDNGDTILCYAIDSNSVAVSDTTSITILDKIAPKEATIILDTDMATGYSGSATISHTDNESGIKITACKWEINQISSLIGTEASKYSNSFTNDGEKIEISGDTAGAWYLHVLSVDNAGNARETVKKCRADVSKSPKVVINGETVTLTEDDFKYYIGKSEKFGGVPMPIVSLKPSVKLELKD